ncbi:hypothetical protein ACWGOE_01760 [Leucobacter chromiiresistens]
MNTNSATNKRRQKGQRVEVLHILMEVEQTSPAKSARKVEDDLSQRGDLTSKGTNYGTIMAVNVSKATRKANYTRYTGLPRIGYSLLFIGLSVLAAFALSLFIREVPRIRDLVIAVILLLAGIYLVWLDAYRGMIAKSHLSVVVSVFSVAAGIVTVCGAFSDRS